MHTKPTATPVFVSAGFVDVISHAEKAINVIIYVKSSTPGVVLASTTARSTDGVTSSMFPFELRTSLVEGHDHAQTSMQIHRKLKCRVKHNLHDLVSISPFFHMLIYSFKSIPKLAYRTSWQNRPPGLVVGTDIDCLL